LPKTPDLFTSIGFTGQDLDGESGLNDFRGRIYDSRFGRFLSPDPIISDPMSSQGYGRYAYVRNAPTRFTDPSGFCPGDATNCLNSSVPGGGGTPGGIPYSPIQGPPSGNPYDRLNQAWFGINATSFPTPPPQSDLRPARSNQNGTTGGTVGDVRQG